MEDYKIWLEQQIERCLNDKDLQREHWAFCKAYEKLMESLKKGNSISSPIEEVALHAADDWLDKAILRSDIRADLMSYYEGYRDAMLFPRLGNNK